MDVDACPGPCESKAGHLATDDVSGEAPIQCGQQIAKPRDLTIRTTIRLCLSCPQLKVDGQGDLGDLPQKLEEQRKYHKTLREGSKGIPYCWFMLVRHSLKNVNL